MRPIPLLLILSALALPALSQAAVRVEVLQNRLAHPWGLAFLPDDQGMLITLRGGGSSSAGSQVKACRRRYPACRRCGPTVRAAYWM